MQRPACGLSPGPVERGNAVQRCLGFWTGPDDRFMELNSSSQVAVHSTHVALMWPVFEAASNVMLSALALSLSLRLSLFLSRSFPLSRLLMESLLAPSPTLPPAHASQKDDLRTRGIVPRVCLSCPWKSGRPRE